MGDRQWFVLYVLVCLEVGVFLMFVPWSAVWERNYFLETYPSLRPVFLSPMLRGAVCGLGFANIYVGVTEVVRRFRDSIVRSAEADGATDSTDSTDSAESEAPRRAAPAHEEP